MSWLVETCLLTFALSAIGGIVPLVLRRTERLQHLLVAFSAGVFLAVVFLHLLPEVASFARMETRLWSFVLAGVVGLYLLENVAIRGNAHGSLHGGADDGQHRALGYATLFGLGVHAFANGLGLSAAEEIEELRAPMLLSVVSHKSVEALSLSTVLLLAAMDSKRVLVLVLALSLATPVGAIAGHALLPDLGSFGLQALTALAAGTFLFVALYDLLPEVFHEREDTGLKVGLLVAGIALGGGLHLFTG